MGAVFDPLLGAMRTVDVVSLTSLAIGATISAGADTLLLFQDGALLAENANLSFSKATGLLKSTLLALGGATIGSFALNATGDGNFSGNFSADNMLAGSAFVVNNGAGLVYWVGRTVLSSPVDGKFNLTNNAQTIGAGLDASTDSVLKIRNRAQNAYATVDALAYKASGVAGATAGPFTAITGITVVGGIITAISGT